MDEIESRNTRWPPQWLLRPRLGVPALTLLVAAFIIGPDNIAFWRELASVSRVGDAGGWPFAAATAVLLVSALALLLSLFAFRWLYKPFLIAILLTAAVVGYFMGTYGVVVDDTMILNTLNTDVSEVHGLLNPALYWHLFVYWLLPSALILWVQIKRGVWWRQALVRVAFVVVMAVVAFAALASHYKTFSLTSRAHRELRLYINPTYAIYSAMEVAYGQAAAANHPLVKIGMDAHRSPAADERQQRKIVILVVGETTRAANWGLSGYRRHTTPELAALDHLLNFPDAHSCGTSTAISVPCMFSYTTREDFDVGRASYTENLLDLLQRAGVTVLWLENQEGGCKGVCERVPTVDMRKLRIPGVCGDDNCLDSVFLHGLRKRIKSTSGDLLLVLHSMGSHGPKYFKRYPEAFRVYTPTCNTNRPQQCSRQSLINSYDNTIRYIDHVLAALIDLLKGFAGQADTALVYLSDHGESLGEHGIYLHGFPYLIAPDEQTHIPMILWMAPGFVPDSGLTRACARRQTRKRVGHDHLFSTVMGLMDVESQLYDPDLDILAPCRGPAGGDANNR